jgi:hypothetical protein
MAHSHISRRARSRSSAVTAWLLALIVCLALSVAEARPAQAARPATVLPREQDISLVRAALARNTEDLAVLERAESKLARLDDEKLEIAVSLARRISESPSTVAVEFAYLLLAAMIITL